MVRCEIKEPYLPRPSEDLFTSRAACVQRWEERRQCFEVMDWRKARRWARELLPSGWAVRVNASITRNSQVRAGRDKKE